MVSCWKALAKKQNPDTTTPPSQGIRRLLGSTGTSQSATTVSLDEVHPNEQILKPPKGKTYTFAELKKATRNFRQDGVLGEDGFGKVFKGWVDDKTYAPSKPGNGMAVAVKRLNPESFQGIDEWRSEVNLFGRLSHPNLVKLIGFCLEGEELLLVYEFMQRGSLGNHLFGTRQPLSWSMRLKIALDAAHGLAFLHTLQKPVIHRDVKTSTILLDGQSNAKLSTSGLAKNGPESGDSHVTTRVMGTYGYAAPEYIATGHLYVKSDVYSFGVVLLEMLTGRRAIDNTRPSGQHNIVEWAKPLLPHRTKLMRIMDPRLEKYPVKDAIQVAKLTLKCLAPDPRSRPSMTEVVKALEQIQCINYKVETEKQSTSKNNIDESGHSSSGAGTGQSLTDVSLDEGHPDRKMLETAKVKVYSFKELKKATRNFELDTNLEGGEWRGFKGWVDEKTYAPSTPGIGMIITVKKLNPKEGMQRFQGWQTEVNFLGRLSHPNLVKLIGFCHEDKELLLVYEFTQRGSLANHLFARGSACEPLSWRIRLKIAVGAARGLAFLHASQTPLIHRDFKTSIILLDGHFNAKLSNFGLAKKFPVSGDSHVSTTQVMGTFGYIAPEYIASGQLYVQSDVYSFGVVLLEILTGQRVIDFNRPSEQRFLVDWTKPLLSYPSKLIPIIDSRLNNRYPVKGAVQAAQLTLKCLDSDPRNRPSMKEVVEALEQIQFYDYADFSFPGTSKNSVNESGHSSSNAGTNQTSTSVSLDEVYPDGQILETPKVKIYAFAELMIATENFRPDMILGEGSFGKVFKGWVDEKTYAPLKPRSGMIVAVKKLNTEGNMQGLEEWQLEVNFLGKLSHPNLLKLIGYCWERKEFLLVYEFMQRGSLENHLFQRGSAVKPPSWSIRLKIALGAARGLAFLHTSQKEVIYRDFKASNILLDRHFNAKLSHIGLAMNGPASEDSHLTTQFMGTSGHLAPEYVATGHLYMKSDVYGFGVVLLEMLTGLRAVDTNRPVGKHNLVDWAKPLLSNRRKLLLIMDSRLNEKYPIKGALQAAKLILKCIESDQRNRPSMKEVVEALEKIRSIKLKEPKSSSKRLTTGHQDDRNNVHKLFSVHFI